jgi:hypothetical protein
VPDRVAGALLFLPVPVVLWLFTRAPLGPGWSLAIGVAVMVTHRLYARPFALARAGRRCLWCGGTAVDGPAIEIDEPLGRTTWRACSPDHAGRARRFFGWAAARGRLLQVGILGTLAAFLVTGALIASGHAGPVRYADAANAFRLGIALTVLPLGLFAVHGPPVEGPLRAPFPVHIQALVGTWAVSWLFRLVGIAWLALAVAHFAGRT